MDKGEESFFVHLQEATRSGDPNRIAPFAKFLKLYSNAYDKLPKLKRDVWLIAPFDDDWAKILKDDNARLQTRMGPASVSIYGGKEFINRKYGPAKIIARIRNPLVANMADYIPDGVRETVLPPGMKLVKFQETQHLSNGTIIFHLKVITGSEKLLPKEHFVCPIVACNCQCKYPSGHASFCTGCILLPHRCDHHCKPKPQCSLCLKQCCNLRQCKQCQGKFCPKCCMQKTDELKF